MGKRLKSRGEAFHVVGCAVAGIAFASGGLGAVHALAYPIGTEYHLPHGRSNAIMLPHVMKFNLSGNPEKVCECRRIHGEMDRGAPSCEESSVGHRSCSRTSGNPPDSLSPTGLWNFQKGLSEMCRRGNEVCEAFRS